MKSNLLLSLALLLTLGATQAFSQRFMKVNDNLLATEPMITGSKGFKAVPLYYFGEYKVVDSRSGMATTQSTGSGLGEVSNESQKLSFTLVNGAGDSVKVKMKKGAQLIEVGTLFKNSSITMGNIQVVSTINAFNDSIDWTLATSFESTKGFSGALKVGDTEYDVIQVNEWADGRMNPLRGISIWLGFGIFDGDKELAAVQTAPVKSGVNKFGIWIDPSLPQDQQLKLAATCVTLIVTTSQNLLTQ